VVAGVAVGSAVGCLSVAATGLVATVVFFLGWSAWQIERLGGAAVGVGFLGFFACVGSGLEVPRAWAILHAPVRHVVSVRAWPASERSSVLMVEQVVADDGAGAYEGTPLLEVEGGPVVAFRCVAPGRERHASGRVLVPTALWDPTGVDSCAEGASRVLERLRARGRAIDSLAAERRFVAFEDAIELARAVQPRLFVRAIVALFVLFALAVILVRSRGYASASREGP
jgi:hypothetical protein